MSRILGTLQEPHETWNAALRHWLDGRVLCAEAKRYVSHVMVVTRARPEGEEDEVGNSDVLRSDEEFDLRTEDLAQALETRVGGRIVGRDARAPAADATEQGDARDAFDMVEGIWADAQQ